METPYKKLLSTMSIHESTKKYLANGMAFDDRWESFDLKDVLLRTNGSGLYDCAGSKKGKLDGEYNNHLIEAPHFPAQAGIPFDLVFNSWMI